MLMQLDVVADRIVNVAFVGATSFVAAVVVDVVVDVVASVVVNDPLVLILLLLMYSPLLLY
jgi:hypothetical protein